MFWLVNYICSAWFSLPQCSGRSNLWQCSGFLVMLCSHSLWSNHVLSFSQVNTVLSLVNWHKYWVLIGQCIFTVFLLVRAVGKDAMLHYFPDRVKIFEQKLEQNSQDLPFYLLFLRLFPMSPNWALNMARWVLSSDGQLITILSSDWSIDICTEFWLVNWNEYCPLLG